MSNSLNDFVKTVCRKHGKDSSRLMDIAEEIQQKHGCVSGEAMDLIAKELSIHRVEVESLVSFYSFLSKKPKGKIVVRLCNDIIDEIKGAEKVEEAFCDELGINVGETTPDGKITLEHTPCIGMCDQAPAAMVNEVIVTNLTAAKAREIAAELKKHANPDKLTKKPGDGNNADKLIFSMVNNNIRKRGEVIFTAYEHGAGLTKALSLSPVEVIRDVKTSRLRGRGGAGFPTGMKWEFARQAPDDNRYVICNADEGEPGTFKDRAILTECPDLMFEGMTIAGYAIGSEHGILYLRGEYAYMHAFLEKVLSDRRKKGLLGKNVGGKKGFNFDIRIQMGAGAYICGEETALISSCEGLRGDPKTRPPFPAQKGYLASPTTVNNVETFCCVTRILDKGAAWFMEIGSKGSPSTKLLSVSGDCKLPGVYEVPFGIRVSDLLKMVGAEDTAAVQVGGPSGQMIGPADFQRTICYDDIPTGGSIMIFNSTRNLLHVVSRFMEFFVEESCGYCTPCRAGNVLLKERLDRIAAGKGEPSDLEYLQELGESVKLSSRCGLGQTSPNPVLSTLKNFKGLYEKLVKKSKDGLMQSFDIKAAVAGAEVIAGRPSEKF